MCCEARAISGACPPVAITRVFSPSTLFMRVDDAVHQIGEAVEEPRLHGMHGIGADDFSGVADFHAQQPRRARKQRVGGNADARRQRAAQIFAALGDHVKIDRRAEIHHDARARRILQTPPRC